VSSAFRYDAAGRLEYRTDTIDGRAFSTRFQYDGNDNLTETTYPSGRHVRYAFNAEHQITRVFRPTNEDYAAGFDYHPSGALRQYTAHNGMATSIAFHPQRYWVSSIQAGTGDGALSLTYQYDNVGNVTGIADPRVGMTQTFTYDVLDRLKRAEGPFGVIDHAYDVHGNRQGANYAYAADNPFRLTSYAGLPLTYDGNGNLTSGSQATYTYTLDNLMDTATVPGSVTRFTYDADDWRLKKSIDGGATTYFIRGPNGQLLTEWTITGTAATVRDHIYAGSRLLTVATSQTTP
jgi:YD repeat-containing protein